MPTVNAEIKEVCEIFQADKLKTLKKVAKTVSLQRGASMAAAAAIGKQPWATSEQGHIGLLNKNNYDRLEEVYRRLDKNGNFRLDAHDFQLAKHGRSSRTQQTIDGIWKTLLDNRPSGGSTHFTLDDFLHALIKVAMERKGVAGRNMVDRACSMCI